MGDIEMKKNRGFINAILIIAILLFIVFAVFSFRFVHNDKDNSNKPNVDNRNNVYLMDYGDYKRINVSNIKKVTVIRYTEAGDDSKTISDSEGIERTYSYLRSIKLGKETKKTCEDNTIVYNFELDDGFKASIVIECDWVIIKDKRYIIK